MNCVSDGKGRKEKNGPSVAAAAGFDLWNVSILIPHAHTRQSTPAGEEERKTSQKERGLAMFDNEIISFFFIER